MLAKTIRILLVLDILACLLGGAYLIYAPLENALQEQASPPKSSVTDGSKINPPAIQTKEQIPSTGGRVFAFILLGLAFVGVIVATCVEKKDAPLGEFLLQPAFIATVGVMLLNALAYLFAYQFWKWFWDEQILFWGTNISIVLFVYFKAKKIKFVPGIILVLILCGFFIALKPMILSTIEERREVKQKEAAEKIRKIAVVSSFSEVPTVVAFPFIGDCESPGEPGGKQFNVDGTVVSHKNADGSYDFGALEINNRAHADLIEKHPEIKIKKSKKDNYKMGELIKEQDGDYRAWNATKYCWGPKLVSVGYNGYNREAVRTASTGIIQFGPPYNRDLIRDQINKLEAFGKNFRSTEEKTEDQAVRIEEAPINYYGHVILVPKGAKTITIDDGVKGTTKKYTVRWNGMIEEDFPKEEGAESKIPKKVLGFQLISREPESFGLLVKFE